MTENVYRESVPRWSTKMLNIRHQQGKRRSKERLQAVDGRRNPGACPRAETFQGFWQLLLRDGESWTRQPELHRERSPISNNEGLIWCGGLRGRDRISELQDHPLLHSKFKASRGYLWLCIKKSLTNCSIHNKWTESKEKWMIIAQFR